MARARGAIELKNITTVLKSVFEVLVSRSKANFSKNADDYVNPADGLLYCGVCREPKQCRVKAFGIEYIPFCACKCVRERGRRKNHRI